MITVGEYIERKDGKEASVGLIYNDIKGMQELLLCKNNSVIAAYKKTPLEEYSYGNMKAREVCKFIINGAKLCNARNGKPVPFVKGTSSLHNFKKMNNTYTIERFNGLLCGADIRGEDRTLKLRYTENQDLIPEIPYIKLTRNESFIGMLRKEGEEAEIKTRSMEEIRLFKGDLSWLDSVKYYVVKDEEVAEKIFDRLEQWKSVISYDTETSGLRINMFGKIGSSRKKELEEFNEKQKREGKEQIRVDYLVGTIFCVTPNISYYFPCKNRKFKNLYADVTESQTKRVIDKIRANYTIGKYRDRIDDMAEYIRNTPDDQLGSDVILMERCREILETRIILAHNGAFEWKVGWMYHIDTNLKEDTLIMHQLMYKFRNTSSNMGEKSNLKYLSMVELGVNQLDLHDFFIGYNEDNAAEVREKKGAKKKKGTRIDFSYMDEEGSKYYAPADGDLTLRIYLKYKNDMVNNRAEIEYLYQVEVLVSCAIAYMEFYGHRLDEEKIEEVRETYLARMAKLEYEIREMSGYAIETERLAYEQLKVSIDRLEKETAKVKDIGSQIKKAKEEALVETNENRKNGISRAIEKYKIDLAERIEYVSELRKEVQEKVEELNKAIEDSPNKINLGAPAQVADLFFNKLKYDTKEEKPGVGKKELKRYLKEKNKDGSLKYPVIVKYTEWKKMSTMLTKFFDNLQYYMYPGGFIFSSYGQISTATGRMSCSKPNAQQYPKDITAIVCPRDGYLNIDADFSQIEYRTLVAMANEPDLKAKFFDPDVDYHTMMAALMYGVPYALVTPKMRSDAKSFNFGIPYGMGFRSLAILLTGNADDVSVEEAKEKYELYFRDQPNVKKFFAKTKEMAEVRRLTKTKWNRERTYSFEDKDGNFSEYKKSAALRQAGNAVIQGTAADIFKIAVARTFNYIRNNKLFGDVLIINMVHDEQLFEVNAVKLNVKRVLADIIGCMELKLDGFPPLYVGAGVSDSWAHAKGKMAEIHPTLAEQFIEEAKELPIRAEKEGEPEEILKYFDNRVLQFRIDKIKNYVLDESNHNQELHPVIGNLLDLQFDFGAKKEMEKYCAENGLEGEDKDREMAKVTAEQLKRFIAHYELDVDYELFKSTIVQEKELEEEKDYLDGEEDEEELVEELLGGDFALIEEDACQFGVKIEDLIKEFGMIVSKELRVCGIHTSIMSEKKKDELFKYIEERVADADDEGAMEVVFLLNNNILKRTGIWVKNINASEMNTKLKLNSLLYS